MKDNNVVELEIKTDKESVPGVYFRITFSDLISDIETNEITKSTYMAQASACAFESQSI